MRLLGGAGCVLIAWAFFPLGSLAYWKLLFGVSFICLAFDAIIAEEVFR